MQASFIGYVIVTWEPAIRISDKDYITSSVTGTALALSILANGELDLKESPMKVTTTEGPITRNLKRLAMVTVAGIMMGGSASPLYANVPHVNVGLFRSQPVNISNRAPLQLVEADVGLKARGEVDADRSREHADRAEDRVSEDTHDAVRNARIHKERAEARVREHAARTERWTDHRIDDTRRHHEMEERNDD